MKNKFRADNRGVTLVELIVALSISTIILGSIWQFVITSTKTYSSQKDNVDLQMEVQQTMNQIQDLCVDANRSVAYLVGAQEVGNDSEYTEATEATEATTKTLNIYSDKKVSKIEWDKTNERITYQEFKVTNGNIEVPATPAADEGAALPEGVEVLAEGVVGFEADVTKVETNQVVKLKLTFEKGDATYEATRNITLRNQLIACNTPATIYEEDLSAGGALTATLQIIPNQEVNLPQRTVNYPFEATVNNVATGKMQVIWTIGNNTSPDTTIDIEKGLLSIGADETVGNTITVTATLASDRRVKASTTVKVEEAVPTIEIVEAPTYVVRGLSYASSYAEGRPIQVVVTNADNYDYTLSVDEASLAAGIRVDGKSLVIPDQIKDESAEMFPVTLTATALANTSVKHSVTILVRNPEFDMVVNTPVNSTGKYMRGEVVTLSADWSDSAVTIKEVIGSTIYEHEKAVYDADELAKTEIAWSYEYETQKGEVKKVALENVNSFAVPLDIKKTGATIKVTGISKKFETIEAEKPNKVYVVKAENMLNVEDVSLYIQATSGGVTYGEGALIENVAVGSTIALHGDVKADATSTVRSYLGEKTSLTWTISYEGQGENGKDLLLVDTLSNTKQEAKIVVNASGNVTVEEILGKTFTVRLTDVHSNIYKELSFTVQEKMTCNAESPDYSVEYLVDTRENGTQKPFELPVKDGIPFQQNSTGKWLGIETGTEVLGATFDTVNREVIFTPTISGATEGTPYVYDVDNSAGQHLLRAEMTRKNGNFLVEKDGVSWYLWVPYTTAKQVGDHSTNISGECNYANFKVNGVQKAYTYSYQYSDNVPFVGPTKCTLSIIIDETVWWSKTYNWKPIIGWR